jgi:ABC-type transport system substrate-binding protein
MDTAYLAFRADRPPLDDVRVRRALAHALDRDRAPGLGFSGEPVGTGGFLPPTMPGHSHRVAPPYDPERAHSLLAEAGFPDGRRLRALVLAELSWLRGGAGVAEQLGEIGVQATVKTAATLRSCRELIEGEASAFIWSFGADSPDPGGMIGGLLHDTPAVYRDTRVNDLLARAQSGSSQADRLAACRELERAWLGEKVALVPLAYRRRVSLTRPWIHGFWQNALAISTYADIVVER